MSHAHLKTIKKDQLTPMNNLTFKTMETANNREYMKENVVEYGLDFSY